MKESEGIILMEMIQSKKDKEIDDINDKPLVFYYRTRSLSRGWEWVGSLMKRQSHSNRKASDGGVLSTLMVLREK